MGEMVERMCAEIWRAIEAEQGYKGDRWPSIEKGVRAAIEAVGEPTEAMVTGTVVQSRAHQTYKCSEAVFWGAPEGTSAEPW